MVLVLSGRMPVFNVKDLKLNNIHKRKTMKCNEFMYYILVGPIRILLCFQEEMIVQADPILLEKAMT